MLLLTSAKWNLVAPIAKNKKKLLKKNRRLIDFFFCSNRLDNNEEKANRLCVD